MLSFFLGEINFRVQILYFYPHRPQRVMLKAQKTYKSERARERESERARERESERARERESERGSERERETDRDGVRNMVTQKWCHAKQRD